MSRPSMIARSLFLPTVAVACASAFVATDRRYRVGCRSVVPRSSLDPWNGLGPCRTRWNVDGMVRKRSVAVRSNRNVLDDVLAAVDGDDDGTRRRSRRETDGRSKDRGTTETEPSLLDEDRRSAHALQQNRTQQSETFETEPGLGKLKSVADTLFAEAPPVSILLLNAVAVIWGSQHAIIKSVVSDDIADAGSFTFLRFGIAALVAARYIPGLSNVSVLSEASTNDVGNTAILGSDAPGNDADTNDSDRKTWRWGAELGLWMFLGFAFQAVGLESTTAQRSGFLLYLNVKFVPIFAKLLFNRQISTPTWLSAVAAFVGTAMLAFDGTAVTFNSGDLWSIAAAASSAMFILRLESASQNVSDSAGLNAASLCVVTVLAGIWSLLSATVNGAAVSLDTNDIVTQMGRILLAHPLQILYLGGVTTALANYIQTKAQKDVSAERASVIYSMDPVYGAVFSYLILGETLGSWPSYLGAFIVFVAAASNAFLDFGGTTPKVKSDNNII